MSHCTRWAVVIGHYGEIVDPNLIYSKIIQTSNLKFAREFISTKPFHPAVIKIRFLCVRLWVPSSVRTRVAATRTLIAGTRGSKSDGDDGEGQLLRSPCVPLFTGTCILKLFLAQGDGIDNMRRRTCWAKWWSCENFARLTKRPE